MKIACSWLYALSKYGYPPKYEDTLKSISQIAKWGFDAFEMEAIGEENLRFLLSKYKEIRDHIDSNGLTLGDFVTMLPGITSLDPKIRNANLKLFDLGAELATALGSKCFMTDSYEVPLNYVGASPAEDLTHYGQTFNARVSPDFDWDRFWDNLVDTFSRCNEIAKEHGVRLAIEMRMGEAVSNTDAFLRLYDAINDPNFGAIFDTGHIYAQKEILPLSVEKLKDRIFFIHAADNDGTTNKHLPPGEGTIDWKNFIAALRKHKYQGYLALDIGDYADLEQGYLRSKKFLEPLLNN